MPNKTKKRGRPGRPPGRNGKPRRDRADDMLSTALRLFAKLGFANVTIKDIAAAAGMNPALIYYYYEDKEDLFLAALRYAVNAALDSHEDIGVLERTADPALTIRHWFEKNRRLFTTISQFFKLMLDYRASQSRIASVQRLINNFYAAEMSLIERSIQRGIASGQFCKVDVARTALFVSTHLDGLIAASIIRSEIDMAQSINQFEIILFDYLGYDLEADRAARRLDTAPMPLALS